MRKVIQTHCVQCVLCSLYDCSFWIACVFVLLLCMFMMRSSECNVKMFSYFERSFQGLPNLLNNCSCKIDHQIFNKTDNNARKTMVFRQNLAKRKISLPLNVNCRLEKWDTSLNYQMLHFRIISYLCNLICATIWKNEQKSFLTFGASTFVPFERLESKFK